MQFSDLNLFPPILRALTHEGYATPTPIQREAIPHALAGRDLFGCAQTGTGKTAAFALPILHRLATATLDKSRRGPRKARALILAPTRELASQIEASFIAYGRDTGLDQTVIYGGVGQRRQERAIARGIDIIVATPGRLLDLMEQRIVDLSAIEVLVLDEADRMLDMGFIQPIKRIAAATPATRQTLFFSATMPKVILQLAGALLKNPVKVAVETSAAAAPKIDQSLFLIGRDDKQSLLQHLLSDAAVTRAVVFTKTKHGAERVGRRLARAGITAETIHGNKNQNQRERALDRFRRGQARILVATDVAARGLDVDDISHVVNFDLPMEPEAYIHRIGRTARAGAAGIALSFCDSSERTLLRDIERLIGGRITVRVNPEFPRAERDAAPAHADRTYADRTPYAASPRRAAAPHDRFNPHTPGDRPAHPPRHQSNRGPSSSPQPRRGFRAGKSRRAPR